MKNLSVSYILWLNVLVGLWGPHNVSWRSPYVLRLHISVVVARYVFSQKKMRNLAASYLLWLNLNVTSGLSILQTCHWLIYSTNPYCKLLNLHSFVRVFCEVEDIR